MPGYLYSRRLIKKPAPVLYNKNGLAVIDAAFPLPAAEPRSSEKDEDISPKGVHRIISCISGDGATSLLKMIADSIITGDTSVTDKLYGNRDYLCDYFPVFIDALAYTPDEDFDIQLYDMAMAAVETDLSPQQFYNMLRGEKVLLLADNAGKLRQEKLYSFLGSMKNSEYNNFIITLSPSAVEDENVLEILEQFSCRHEIVADSIDHNEDRLINAYRIFNNGGEKSELTRVTSVRRLLYEHYFPDISVRFLLQTYLTNASRPLTEFQLLHLYFTKEFPVAYHSTYTDVQDVLFIMPFIAGAEWADSRPMTKEKLYAIVEKCSPYIYTDTADGGTDKIVKELVNTFGLLDEYNGIYRFERAAHMCYFGAMALIDRNGIDLNSYLSRDNPDFNLLVQGARYAFANYSTYPDAEYIIDFALRHLKSFIENYPHLIGHFDIVEEMGKSVLDRSPMGSLIYLLTSCVKEFSPLMKREKVNEIYSHIFRFPGTAPQLDDVFDPRQCCLEQFCMDNYKEFSDHASRVYIAVLIRQGLNPYTALSQHIMEESDDDRRKFLAYTLAVAVRLYGLYNILRLHTMDIPQQLVDFLRGFDTGGKDEYRLCIECIENQKNYTGFFFLSQYIENQDEFYFRSYLGEYCDSLMNNTAAEQTEDYFVNTLITPGILSCSSQLTESQRTAIQKKYLPAYNTTTDRRLALRYFKILTLTGRWEKHQLARELKKLDERFSSGDSFSWDGIGAETTPEELVMLKKPPAIVTFHRIEKQIKALSL